MRGQAAVEYLIIFSAVLAIFAAVTYTRMINPSREAAGEALHLSHARSAADSIAGAIDSVYANGKGSVRSVSFQIDSSWDLYLENTKGYENVRVKIETPEGIKCVDSRVKYAFADNLLNIPPRTYTVIVEWVENEAEGITPDVSADIRGNVIHIHIKPPGRS